MLRLRFSSGELMTALTMVVVEALYRNMLTGHFSRVVSFLT
jgi:hypothetical protein